MASRSFCAVRPSQLGDRTFDLALIWMLTGLTASTLVIGSTLTVSHIPMLLLLIIGGASADLVDRVKASRAQLLRTLVMTIFAALVVTQKFLLPALFVFTALNGALSAFFYPALVALLPSLLPQREFAAANAGGAIVVVSIGALFVPAVRDLDRRAQAIRTVSEESYRR